MVGANSIGGPQAWKIFSMGGIFNSMGGGVKNFHFFSKTLDWDYLATFKTRGVHFWNYWGSNQQIYVWLKWRRITVKLALNFVLDSS